MKITMAPLRQNHVLVRPAERLGPRPFAVYAETLTAHGGRFSEVDRGYVLELTRAPEAIGDLKRAGFTVVGATLRARFREVIAQTDAARAEASKRIDAIETRSGWRFLPFQRTGVAWLASRRGALLADDMGLGKTCQVLGALPEGVPVLVVCPAVAKGVWRDEVANVRPDLRPVVLKGRGSFRWPKAGELVVVNYDVLPEEIDAAPWPETVLVADEAHALRSARSQRTLRFLALAGAVRATQGTVWCVTATPLMNRPPDLWNLLRCAGVEREAFGTWLVFARAMDGKEICGSWEWGTPLEEASERLRRVMLRRAKVEVLRDLPPKFRRVLRVELSEALTRKCDAVLREYPEGALEALLDKDPPATMATVRKALAAAKLGAALEWAEAREEEGEPCVIFSAHRAPVEAFATRPGWAVIHGDVSPDDRAEIQARFQRGELRGIAATIQAAGVALTLTRAAQELFIDLDWTPANNLQAEDRCYRIGQTRGVQVVQLMADHRLEEALYAILRAKQQRIEASVYAAERGGQERAETPADRMREVMK